MTPDADKHSLTLALYPTSRGLGWAALSGPFAPYDWGTFEPKGDKNLQCLKAAEQLLARLRPVAVVFEAYEAPAPRWPRIVALCADLAELAGNMDAQVAIYGREEVQACFSHLGAVTRDGVAQSVARVIPALAPILPDLRRPWQPEPRKLCIFHAAAVAFTHYAASSRDLLDRLRQEAEGDSADVQ